MTGTSVPPTAGDRAALSRSERLSRHVTERRMWYFALFGVIVIVAAVVFLVPVFYA